MGSERAVPVGQKQDRSARPFALPSTTMNREIEIGMYLRELTDRVRVLVCAGRTHCELAQHGQVCVRKFK